jgi:hypothetical protein
MTMPSRTTSLQAGQNGTHQASTVVEIQRVFSQDVPPKRKACEKSTVHKQNDGQNPRT